MSKLQAELDWWINLNSKTDFVSIRHADYLDKTGYFPELATQGGLGLDLGCGPYSIWEFGGKDVIPVDPLIDEYLKFAPGKKLGYVKADGEALPFTDEMFDWVFCVNVIDHTPNPEKMISEIKRVLKPGGKLYFEVHFDDELGGCHYRLWRDNVVDEVVTLKKLRSEKRRIDENLQTLYIGVYEKS